MRKAGKRANKGTFTTLSPFRYPGGKSWLRSRVIDWLKQRSIPTKLFIEPFCGGASVSLAVAELKLVPNVLIIERDPSVAAVWRVIFEGDSDRLVRRIRKFKVSRAAVVDVLTDDTSEDVAVAFRCLLRNR